MRDLIKAKYYVYYHKRGGFMPFTVVYQNESTITDKKWIECIICNDDGMWAGGSNISRDWMIANQWAKIKKIPEAIKSLAEWISTPEEVQP